MEKSIFNPYEASDDILRENGIDPEEEKRKQKEGLEKKKSPFTEKERLDAIEKSEFKVYSKEEFFNKVYKSYDNSDINNPSYNEYFLNIKYLDSLSTANEVFFDNVFYDDDNNLKSEFLCLKSGNDIIGVCFLKQNHESNKMDLRFLSIHDHYKNSGGSKKLIKNVFEYCKDNNIILQFSTFTEEGNDYLRKASFSLAKEYKEKHNLKTYFSVVHSKFDDARKVFYEEFISGNKKYLAVYASGENCGEFIDFIELKN